MYEAIAVKLNLAPEELSRRSLRLYLENRLRLVESQLLDLTRRYAVETVTELDALIAQGKVTEAEAFEDTFEFDYLESERDTLLESLETLG
ncbi:MAG: hypothetical protein MUQ65_02120 [Armatimonadetes bacterium]|nr:hypothetical protein [Armatimonadota bacterium]